MATPDWIRKELQAHAARAGRRAGTAGPRAAKATYLAKQAMLHLELKNGVVLGVPVSLIPALKKVGPRHLRTVEVLGRGGGLHWPGLDLDLSVPALVSSAFDGRAWMSELGRFGGRQSSEAKAAAARRNGRKGGRPRSRPHPSR